MEELFYNITEIALDYAQKAKNSELIYSIVELYKAVKAKQIFINEDTVSEVYNCLIKAQKEYYARFSAQMYEKYAPKDCVGESKFTGKGIVYTSITGGYDSFTPSVEQLSLDFCLVTDGTVSADNCDVMVLDNSEGLPPLMLQKYAKFFPHKLFPEYDYSIYIDGKLNLIGDISQYISEYTKGRTMLCFPHFERDNIVDELNALIKLKKGNPDIMSKQVQGYLDEGFSGNGLTECACLVRSHHDLLLQKVMEDWWSEVKEKSQRDQLSFGYCCWKNKYQYDLSDLCIHMNKYICAHEHI